MPVYPQRGLHGHVVRAIGKRIVDGGLRPDVALDVDALESEFGVSRTVIREALKVLAAKGLVDARPKRGTFVRPRSDWSLLDPDLLQWQYENRRSDSAFLDNLAEVRAIVEPAGARLAAVRRSEEDLAGLQGALDAMAKAGRDPERVIVADLAFHRLLLGAAHNELLERMEVVLEAGLNTRDRLVHEARGWTDPVPAHRAVLDAVRAGDPGLATSAMNDLLAQATRDVLGGLS